MPQAIPLALILENVNEWCFPSTRQKLIGSRELRIRRQNVMSLLQAAGGCELQPNSARSLSVPVFTERPRISLRSASSRRASSFAQWRRWTSRLIPSGSAGREEPSRRSTPGFEARRSARWMCLYWSFFFSREDTQRPTGRLPNCPRAPQLRTPDYIQTGVERKLIYSLINLSATSSYRTKARAGFNPQGIHQSAPPCSPRSTSVRQDLKPRRLGSAGSRSGFSGCQQRTGNNACATAKLRRHPLAGRG